MTRSKKQRHFTTYSSPVHGIIPFCEVNSLLASLFSLQTDPAFTLLSVHEILMESPATRFIFPWTVFLCADPSGLLLLFIILFEIPGHEVHSDPYVPQCLQSLNNVSFFGSKYNPFCFSLAKPEFFLLF